MPAWRRGVLFQHRPGAGFHGSACDRLPGHRAGQFWLRRQRRGRDLYRRTADTALRTRNQRPTAPAVNENRARAGNLAVEAVAAVGVKILVLVALRLGQRLINESSNRVGVHFSSALIAMRKAGSV